MKPKKTKPTTSATKPGTKHMEVTLPASPQPLLAPSVTTENVCEKHGVADSIMIQLNGKVLGEYCILCFNEMIQKHCCTVTKRYKTVVP